MISPSNDINSQLHVSYILSGMLERVLYLQIRDFRVPLCFDAWYKSQTTSLKHSDRRSN